MVNLYLAPKHPTNGLCGRWGGGSGFCHVTSFSFFEVLMSRVTRFDST